MGHPERADTAGEGGGGGKTRRGVAMAVVAVVAIVVGVVIWKQWPSEGEVPAPAAAGSSSSLERGEAAAVPVAPAPPAVPVVPAGPSVPADPSASASAAALGPGAGMDGDNPSGADAVVPRPNVPRRYILRPATRAMPGAQFPRTLPGARFPAAGGAPPGETRPHPRLKPWGDRANPTQ